MIQFWHSCFDSILLVKSWLVLLLHPTCKVEMLQGSFLTLFSFLSALIPFGISFGLIILNDIYMPATLKCISPFQSSPFNYTPLSHCLLSITTRCLIGTSILTHSKQNARYSSSPNLVQPSLLQFKANANRPISQGKTLGVIHNISSLTLHIQFLRNPDNFTNYRIWPLCTTYTAAIFIQAAIIFLPLDYFSNFLSCLIPIFLLYNLFWTQQPELDF